MKNLLLILFLGLSNVFYAQFTEPTKNHVITEIDGDVVIDWYSENDTIPIPTAELEEFFLALDTLETQDSLKSNLILDLERTIKLYELLAEQDSLVIKFKDEEIYLLNEQIQLHLNRLDEVDKWYNKPSVGIAAGFLGTIILIQALDYTLPE